MSDTSQGPGWWQASDGKWYGPELYPKEWGTPPGLDEPAAADPAPAAADPTPAVPPVVEDFDSGATIIVPPDASAVTPPAMPAPEAPTAPSTPSFDAPDPSPAPAAWSSPEPAAPSGWSTPEPSAAAVAETTVTPIPEGTFEPTAVQPVVAPSAPQAPPTSWGTGAAAPLGAPVGAPPAAAASSGADMPAGVLGLLAGALLVVGSFLNWAKAAGTLTGGSVNGLTGSNGWGTLICGLAVAAAAGLLLAGQRKWHVGAAMATAGVVGLGLAIYSLLDIGSTSDDLPETLREQGFAGPNVDGAELAYDIGLYIALAGAVLGAIAGVIALMRRTP